MKKDLTKEEEIIEATNELQQALLKQHKNLKDQDRLKVEEIKIRKMVLQARERVSGLRD